jgi:hypothetical protein
LVQAVPRVVKKLEEIQQRRRLVQPSPASGQTVAAVPPPQPQGLPKFTG